MNFETLIYQISFDALALPTAVLKLIGRVSASADQPRRRWASAVCRRPEPSLRTAAARARRQAGVDTVRLYPSGDTPASPLDTLARGIELVRALG